MISARTSKEVSKLIQDYVGQYKAYEFVSKLRDINGTNRSFKFVLDDVLVQIRKNKETPSS